MALVIVGVVAVVIVLGSSGSSTPPGQKFVAAIAPVPTNHVTGSGTGTVQPERRRRHRHRRYQGLLNGAAHAMHIHAGGKGVCPPASAARLHNGHLSISTTDGIKFYGPPQVSLTSTGDTSTKSIVDFSRYPLTGNIRYTRKITIPPGVADAIRAGNAAVIVHGIDYNHNGIYDNVLDRSELNNSLPGEATAPALCGSLSLTKTASAGNQRSGAGDVRVRIAPRSRGGRESRNEHRAPVPSAGRRCGGAQRPAREPAARPDPAHGRHLETTIVAFIHGCSEQK